ncbi:MAG: metallophosphoesterase [Bacteroidales bacterium]|nr:metallophosphoesterase [Bacteroidales bacterium]
MMGRRFVIGDIHGAYIALLQCLNKAGFNYKSDTLICLGDVCDGWPEVSQSVSELLKIKNLAYILGNHDEWTLKWFTTGEAPDIWVTQGGKATIQSYSGRIPDSHIKLLRDAHTYFKLENRMFVHGGFDPAFDIRYQDKRTLIWDRNLLYSAIKLQKEGIEKITDYDEIYIGHTPTLNFGKTEPLIACELYLLDTGAGYRGGFLTMMDIDTKETYVSDQVDLLYPGYYGRG